MCIFCDDGDLKAPRDVDRAERAEAIVKRVVALVTEYNAGDYDGLSTNDVMRDLRSALGSAWVERP